MPVGAGFIPARIGENKKMTEHKKLQPEIRFAGFTDDWEQRKLGEIVDVFDGTHQTPKYTDKGIMFLSVEDIKTLKSEKYISEEDFKKEFKYFPEIGDVLMTRIGDVGTTNVICSTQPIAYYVSLALLKNKNSDPYFLSTVISSGSVQSDIWKRTLHIAFPKKINKSEIEKVIIPLPSYVEQTQIGNFFKQLDDTIALHQGTLEKYQKLKISYLEKMFPKGNERYPELRFPNFTDAWEQCKLGNIADVRDGTHSSPIYYEEGFPLVTSKNLKENGLDLTDVSFISMEDYLEINKRSKVNYGDILLGLIGTIGNPVLVDSVGFAIKNVGLIKNSENFYKYFLIQILKSSIFENYVSQKNTGNTQKFLGLDTLRNFQFLCPSKEEQTQIGNFFKQLDDTIALHQREVEKYKKIKQSYLEKMFI